MEDEGPTAWGKKYRHGIGCLPFPNIHSCQQKDDVHILTATGYTAPLQQKKSEAKAKCSEPSK